jgi:hypothetical protein
MEDDEFSDNDMAETIAGTINSHMANLSMQTTASIKASATQINAPLLQLQLAGNNNQLNLQQQAILQQMAMLSKHTPLQQWQGPRFPQPHTSFLSLPFKGTSSSTSRWSRNRTISSSNSTVVAEVVVVEVGMHTVLREVEDETN